MKNLDFINAFKSGMIKMLLVGISLTVMSFKTVEPTANNYEIVNAKIFLSGKGSMSDLNLAVATANIKGKFTANSGELEDISGFHFVFSFNQENAANQKLGELKSALTGKNCNELVVTQNRIMILPIMKMMHLLVDVEMGDAHQSVSLKLPYVINEDGSISITGKEYINLRQLGIILPNTKAGDPEEEIALNISLKLAKPQANS